MTAVCNVVVPHVSRLKLDFVLPSNLASRGRVLNGLEVVSTASMH